jgi:hypothetical protein
MSITITNAELENLMKELQLAREPLKPFNLPDYVKAAKLMEDLLASYQKNPEDLSAFAYQEKFSYLKRSLGDLVKLQTNMQKAQQARIDELTNRLILIDATSQTTLPPLKTVPSADLDERFRSLLPTSPVNEQNVIVYKVIGDLLQENAQAYNERLFEMHTAIAKQVARPLSNGTSLGVALGKAERDALVRQIEGLEAKQKYHKAYSIADMDDKIRNFRAKVEAVQAEHTVLSAKFKTINSMIDKHNEQLLRQKDCTFCGMKEELLTKAQSSIQNLELRNATFSKTIKDLNMFVANSSNIAGKVAELKAAHDRADASERKLTTFSDKLAVRDAEMIEYASKITDLESENAQLNRTCAKLSMDIHRTNEKLETTEGNAKLLQALSDGYLQTSQASRAAQEASDKQLATLKAESAAQLTKLERCEHELQGFRLADAEVQHAKIAMDAEVHAAAVRNAAAVRDANDLATAVREAAERHHQIDLTRENEERDRDDAVRREHERETARRDRERIAQRDADNERAEARETEARNAARSSTNRKRSRSRSNHDHDAPQGNSQHGTARVGNRTERNAPPRRFVNNTIDMDCYGKEICRDFRNGRCIHGNKCFRSQLRTPTPISLQIQASEVSQSEPAQSRWEPRIAHLLRR